MSEKLYDVFICHASEDKKNVVRPLVQACTDAGITVWHDEDQIEWGDSITQAINAGLSRARYVIVVLSPSSVNKAWPSRELLASLSVEASTGSVRILPLIVGTTAEKKRILDSLPLLHDKLHLAWDGDPSKVVAALESRLVRAPKSVPEEPTSHIRIPRSIPLPKVRRKPSDEDRDVFLHDAYATIRDYFLAGLDQLGTHYPEVNGTLTDIDRLKFVAKIYLGSDLASTCKIWVGGLTSSESIGYQEGHVDLRSDNSYNDLLTVVDEDGVLRFRTFGILHGHGASGQSALSAEEAAAYLWQRFTKAIAE